MRLSNRVTLSLAAVLVMLVAASSSRAQGTPEERSACIDDAFRFCSADIPDVPKIESCLVSNVALLSPPCRAEFTSAGKSKLHRRHFDK